MHRLSFRLAESKHLLMVKLPGRSEFESVKIGVFTRPADATSADDGRVMCKLDGETLDGFTLWSPGEKKEVKIYANGELVASAEKMRLERRM
jgi:hypothetical protein